MKKRIAILGATGSIGKSTLDVISQNKENFEVVLLSAHSNRSGLEKISAEWPDAVCILASEGSKQNLLDVIDNAHADITVNGISGAAGLEPSIAAIKSGSNLALANKETIVLAGKLVLSLAEEKKVKIIPVDSEHSAIFKLIEGVGRRETGLNVYQTQSPIQEIILTASGGPFRNYTIEQMQKVTAKDALAHPTWNMGPKITIDSASMANKGLEVIEAASFFNLPPEKIKVVIHPQSIVHSMVRLVNGVVYAQLSKPDMRYPIHDALYWPHTTQAAFDPLNFDSLSLEFKKPDMEKFPMLALAYKAAKQGGLYPCAYNAANEIAAAAFMEGQIGFLDIPRITSYVLEADWGTALNLENILNADTEARKIAYDFLSNSNDN